MLTLEQVQASIPPQTKIKVDQEFVDKLNSLSSDEDLCKEFRENFISYTNILKQGKFKLDDYLNAVKFVTFLLMGFNNKESYQRAFPERYFDMKQRGLTDKEISSFVSAYRKNKLVNNIFEQTLTPTWILNADLHQKALNTQADLMLTAKSEKVRCDAANSILTHLKQPEKKEIELNIGVKDSSGLNELKNTMTLLAQQQSEMIKQGVSTKEIAHQSIMVDVTPDEDNNHAN